MAIYEGDGRFIPEKEIGMNYTWVIPIETNCIAVDDDTSKLHRDIVREARFADISLQFPPVHDGGKLIYSVIRGLLIPRGFTTSTSPVALNGLKFNTPEFDKAFIAMRSVSAQMLADLIGESITAEFRDGTSKQFFPRESAN